MKIINVLKDDSFEEILELFRKAPEGEVFLVLPRNGKVFRREDHFAAFASEAAQGRKTVSILTANAQTAVLARKFGFTVIASPKSGLKAPAVLASKPPPADPDIREENDDAFSDVPMTSDATMGNTSTDVVANDEDPIRNMQVLDEEGNPVDDNADGKTDEPAKDDLEIADESGDQSASLASEPAPSGGHELDYIDAMWRDKVGRAPSSPGFVTKVPSFFSRTFSLTARSAGGSSMPKKVAVGILMVAIVVLGSVVYAITGSAHVAIEPVGKPLDTQIAVQASDTTSAVDDTFLKIPGQLLEVEKTGTNTVPATGKRDVASKARGKITVTNEFSSTSQALVATTRFQSPDGKVFRTLQSITVPGSRVVAGKTVAGTKVVDVIADKPGPDYNIAAGKFVIVAFVEKGDNDKAGQFYGVANQPMSGGASGPSSVVTQTDYDTAQFAAIADFKNQIKDALAAQGSSLQILDGVDPVMEEAQSSSRVDDAAESVTATAKGTLKTIGIKGSDLTDLIRANILKKDRLVVIPEKLEITYSDIKFNSDLSTLNFTVNIKGTGYEPVDTDAVKRDIEGKNTASIRDYFNDKAGIQSAAVTLSPFWVREVPKNPAKINVELLYNQPDQTDR